jgi:hypothetical protein
MKARLALAFLAAVFFICFVIFFHPECPGRTVTRRQLAVADHR